MRLHSSVLESTFRLTDRRRPQQAAHGDNSSNSLSKDHLSRAFASSLPLPAQTESQLLGALCQVLQLPGSLVRAQLVYGVACAYQVRDDQAQDMAVAIEYFHSASLLFDDLPCMDNAEQRRGALCVHQVYGEAPAILAALALINRAYALLWHALAGFPLDRQSAALTYLEKWLGIEGLLNGQSLDLHYSGVPHSEFSSQQVALSKTVSLIRISLVLPALAAGAPATDTRLLERLAVFWGLSYQIFDDLKDVYQKPAQTGKTGDRDAGLQRPNVALDMGAEKSLHRIERLMHLGDRVVERLVRRLPALSFLQEICRRFREEVAALETDRPAPGL
jgi:geranylgeranyl diphosphate synthase, type II